MCLLQATKLRPRAINSAKVTLLVRGRVRSVWCWAPAGHHPPVQELETLPKRTEVQVRRGMEISWRPSKPSWFLVALLVTVQLAASNYHYAIILQITAAKTSVPNNFCVFEATTGLWDETQAGEGLLTCRPLPLLLSRALLCLRLNIHLPISYSSMWYFLCYSIFFFSCF